MPHHGPRGGKAGQAGKGGRRGQVPGATNAAPQCLDRDPHRVSEVGEGTLSDGNEPTEIMKGASELQFLIRGTCPGSLLESTGPPGSGTWMWILAFAGPWLTAVRSCPYSEGTWRTPMDTPQSTGDLS